MNCFIQHKVNNTQKKLKSLTNLYEFILIEGNHDKNILYEIPSHKVLRLNDIEFIHEATVDDRHQISGHYHPTLSIKLNGKRVTEKCILQTESKLILPSFGKYTGGLSINNKIFKPYLKFGFNAYICCLLYTSPSPRAQRGSRMPSSA